jgi:hypothetical protein
MRRLGDNIKMHLKQIGRKFVDIIHLAQCRMLGWVLVNTAMELPVQKRVRNILT